MFLPKLRVLSIDPEENVKFIIGYLEKEGSGNTTRPFFEKWNEMHGGNLEEKLWPDPLWFLEEIIVDPTLNDPSVKKYTLYENKAYPQFYEKDEETGMSIMDLVKGCYERKESIEGFLEEAYGVVKGYCGRLN